MTPSQFVADQITRAKSFRSALTKESDRGCALFAAAYLDKALSDLLYVSLVEDKSIEKDLFDGSAPLGTFSARIKIAYYLGLISVSCRRDLDLVRTIRNDFAHNAEIISFEDQKIAQRCRTFVYSYHEKKERPRAHFTSAVMGTLSQIQGETLLTVPHKPKTNEFPSEDDKESVRKKVRSSQNPPA
jgi:DNA-binding MltR family transcriptional regulator